LWLGTLVVLAGTAVVLLPQRKVKPVPAKFPSSSNQVTKDTITNQASYQSAKGAL
jgi:hypothetical protein